MTFDLEKARVSITRYHIENTGDVDTTTSALKDLVDQANLAEEMLAEIERLRADNAGLSKAVISIQEERDLAQAEFRAYHKAWEEQAIEIERLLGEKAFLEKVVHIKNTRLKELEDELVKERTGAIRCESYNHCEGMYEIDLPNAIIRAQTELRAEGKIGPDADAKPREGLYGKYCISKADGSPVDPNADYFVLRLDTDPVARRAAREYSYVTPDRDLARGLQDRLAKYDPQLKDCMNIQFFGLEKPHCWQITEERKAAIQELSELLTAIGCPSCHYYIQKNYGEDITVLRAMLEEAEQ